MAAIVPNDQRLFNLEYVQLHSVAEHGDSRMFHAEGPIVISKGQGDQTGDPRPPLLHIGMPENMITWALTPDLPTLKVQRTAFMAAVPYSTRFYIIDFLPETPDEVLLAFEQVLAGTTSYAVANLLVDGSEGGKATATAAIPQAEQEQVEAASGTVFTTTPATASKIRSAGAAISSGIQTVGEHVGKGIVKAGEWYRKRSEGKQRTVQVSETSMRRMEKAKSTTSKVAAVTGTLAATVGAAVGTAAYTAKEGLKSSGVVKEGSKAHRAGGHVKQGVIALVEVFDAMHDAGRHVVSTGVDETVTCVQYRYGDAAGELSKHSFGMVVDAYDVYGAYKRMQHRALAKAFFKGAVRPGTADAVQVEEVPAGTAAAGAMPGTGAATAGTPPTGTESYATPPTATGTGNKKGNASDPKASSSSPPQVQSGTSSGDPPPAGAKGGSAAAAAGGDRALEYRSGVYVPPNNPYAYTSYNELDGESIELLSPLPQQGQGAQPQQQAQYAMQAQQ